MVHHSAYTFDSLSFDSDLEASIIRNGHLRLDLLQEQAKSVVLNADEPIQTILRKLEFDEYWLEDPDKDQSQAYLWYLVRLVPYLREAPNLHGIWIILRTVLPLAAWSEAQINALICGQHLDEVLRKYGNELFLDMFTIHGGCLTVEQATSLLQLLQSSAPYFDSSSSESLELIRERAHLLDVSPEWLLRTAYTDAFDMLKSSVERQEEMYILFRP